MGCSLVTDMLFGIPVVALVLQAVDRARDDQILGHSPAELDWSPGADAADRRVSFIGAVLATGISKLDGEKNG